MEPNVSPDLGFLGLFFFLKFHLLASDLGTCLWIIEHSWRLTGVPCQNHDHRLVFKIADLASAAQSTGVAKQRIPRARP